MDAISSSTSSSSANVIEDIVRLIAPEDRPGFHEMLAHELRNFRESKLVLRRMADSNALRTGKPARDLVIGILGGFLTAGAVVLALNGRSHEAEGR
jgi:hypothetical protein